MAITKKLALGKKCPNCMSKLRHRLTRKTWMRLMPWTRRYYCKECDTDYVSFLSLFTLTDTPSNIVKRHYRSGKKRRGAEDRRQRNPLNYRGSERRSSRDRRLQDRRRPLFVR